MNENCHHHTQMVLIGFNVLITTSGAIYISNFKVNKKVFIYFAKNYNLRVYKYFFYNALSVIKKASSCEKSFYC